MTSVTTGKPEKGGKSTKGATPTTADLARQIVEKMGQGDLDGAAALQHPDVVDDFVAIGTYRGKAEVRRFFEELLGAFPDFTIRITRITAAGEVAVVEWEVDATFTGTPFQGIDANGKHVSLRGVDCMTFEGGLLRHNTVYYDGAAFARAIGLLPAVGSTAEKGMAVAFNALTHVRQRLSKLQATR